MATKISLKKSSVAGKQPVATDLEVGELAVNLADGKLYSKNASNQIISLGGEGGSSSTGFTKTTSNGNKTLSANESCVFLSTGIATLPINPITFDEVVVTVGNFSTASINRNGKLLIGEATNLEIDVPYSKIHLRFIDDTTGWVFA